MNLAVNNPTAALYALAREADPGIAARADAENFVFSPARLSMRTARLRAYLAGLQASAGLFSRPAERSHLWERSRVWTKPRAAAQPPLRSDRRQLRERI